MHQNNGKKNKTLLCFYILVRAKHRCEGHLVRQGVSWQYCTGLSNGDCVDKTSAWEGEKQSQLWDPVMSAIQSKALIRFVTSYLNVLEQITDHRWGQTGDRENDIYICLIGKCYWYSVSVGYYLKLTYKQLITNVCTDLPWIL